MAFIQDTTPKPNQIHHFSLKDFSGGLNNRSNILRSNECTSVLNMVFDSEQVLEKREGQGYYDDVNIGGEVTFMDSFRPYNHADLLIRASEDSVYLNHNKLTDVKGSIDGLNFNGNYIFADGDTLYVYGSFPQEDDTYTKIHGDPIDDFVLLEIVSPEEDHDRLDEDHVKGVLNIDYENYKIFYEPCELEFVDNYKGANVVPEGVRYLESLRGRMYATGHKEDDDNVFITDLSNPYYFPVSLPIQLPPNSDRIQGLVVYDDSVVIGRKDDIHVISGNTNRPDMNVTPFQLRKLNTHTGFANHRCFDVVHNNLFFFGNDGDAYSLSSVRHNENTLATSILSRAVDFRKDPINVHHSEFERACSIYHDDYWHLAFDDVVMLFSYRNMSWLMWNNIDATSFLVYNNDFFWGTSGGDTVSLIDGVYMDFDLPYEAHWHSKILDMDDANSFKQFREFFLVAHTFAEHNTTINLRFEVDYNDVRDRVSIENEFSIWGQSKWGDRFVNRTINDSIPIIIGRRGRNIKIIVRNSSFIDKTVEDKEELDELLGLYDGMFVKVLSDGTYYKYLDREWVEQDKDKDLNQRMRVYQINGDYEIRGKR